ncbi:MAG: hypothetical protein ACYC61_14120 [Isosphaeraceae bacterium]
MSAKRHSTGKREQAAAFLAGGRTVKGVAADCGIGLRTLHTWLAEDPEFNRLVARYRGRLVDRTLGCLARVAAKAVKALDSCLDGSTHDAIRVRAAAEVLGQLVRYREHGEMAERLDRLEAQFGPAAIDRSEEAHA